MFCARFRVLGSKATSWHREFIHANEGCTLTSPLSAYGEHGLGPRAHVGSAGRSLNRMSLTFRRWFWKSSKLRFEITSSDAPHSCLRPTNKLADILTDLHLVCDFKIIFSSLKEVNFIYLFWGHTHTDYYALKKLQLWKLTSLSQTSYTYLQGNQSVFVGLALILSPAHKGCTFKLAFSPLTTMQIGER